MSEEGIGSLPPPPQDPRVRAMEGTVIAGKYQLVRLIGTGGMGAVYEGRNTGTLKRVAVKLLLSPELAANPGIVKRFFREARASSAIESDHVVEVFDSGTDSSHGHPYMVMEFLDGEDLSQTLTRLGSLSPQVSAKLILQASMGLSKAHERGIIHRDIKPANLYLTRRDAGDVVVKVLDFGIAKVKMESFQETSHGLTRTGNMLGTPYYMSPEQARGAAQIDPSSDVWSLGVCLYELLSGALPFEQINSLAELMVSILSQDIPLLQDRAPWVPPELAEITHRAMSRDAQKRYANAGALRDALAEIIPDGSVILPHVLASVPIEQRRYVAPRLVLSDDGMLRATRRTGLTTTASGATSARRATPPAAAVVGAMVAGFALLAGVGIGAWTLFGGSQKPPEEPARAVTPPPAETRIVEKTVVEERAFDLLIGPAGAMAFMDGQPAALESGKIRVTGPVGTTRKVKASFEGRDVEADVIITRDRLVPDRIEVPPEAPRPAAARPAGLRPARASVAAKPTAEKPTAAKAAPRPPIDTEFR